MTIDNLGSALGDIRRNNSEIVAVVPQEIEKSRTARSSGYYDVTAYLIIYYNPPIQGIPSTGGDGDSATIQ